MAVLRDYKCPKHGFFEAFDDEPVCKTGGCTDVKVVMLKPPGIRSDRTKHADRTLKGLAKEFKMHDIKSTREGEHQSGYHTRDVPKESRPGDAAIWGGQGQMNMAAALGGQIAKSVRGESVGVRPRDVGNLTGPRTASYVADHENLQIKK